MEQLTITFSRQNTRENQDILEANKERFSNQCQVVLGALLSGEKLTTTTALVKYQIGDLRRRIKDLSDSGVEISKKLIEGRFKTYFMTDEQIDQFKNKCA